MQISISSMKASMSNSSGGSQFSSLVAMDGGGGWGGAATRGVDLRTEKGDVVDCKDKDNDDGSYDVLYLPTRPGKLKMSATIFSRPIKDSPLFIDVSEHIEPIWRFGSRGAGEDNLNQPTRIASGPEDAIYILDTGNSRIKILGRDGFSSETFRPSRSGHQGCPALSVTTGGQIAVINWRSKLVSSRPIGWHSDKAQYTCPEFIDPIICISARGDKDGQFKDIHAICIGKNDEILVADHRIQIFSKDGKYSRKVVDSGEGSYGGITVDAGGNILATITEKAFKSENKGASKDKGCCGGRSFVHIFHSNGKLLYSIDSSTDRLKRPNGLAIISDFRIVVADLGNNCIKKYYYK
ncbi:hypothetical protein Btru_014272 [Bulinus truncatus]|nr:hypothetical protein Btru_014272 [Bulinus truncatus]